MLDILAWINPFDLLGLDAQTLQEILNEWGCNASLDDVKHYRNIAVPIFIVLGFLIVLAWKQCKNVLVDETVTELPKDSASYLIIHPHYDRYSDYMEFVGDVLYRPIGDSNSKGAKTIEICELNRIEVAIARAIQYFNIHGTGEHYVDFLLLMDKPANRGLVKDEDFERFQKNLKARIKAFVRRQRQG